MNRQYYHLTDHCQNLSSRSLVHEVWRVDQGPNNKHRRVKVNPERYSDKLVLIHRYVDYNRMPHSRTLSCPNRRTRSRHWKNY